MTHEGERQAAGLPRLSARDQERFGESVLPHLDAAYNLARYLMRDADEAEDAVQDAFLRAVRHFGGFRGSDGRAWLLSIVRNACFTRMRQRRTGGGAVEFDEEAHTPREQEFGPEADLARNRGAASVRLALGELAVEFREALVLRELEGLSYKEIAKVTGVPIGTVMSRLARGRQQLAAILVAARGGD